jgi:hypothetical protein
MAQFDPKTVDAVLVWLYNRGFLAGSLTPEMIRPLIPVEVKA